MREHPADMRGTFQVKSAGDLLDAQFMAKWADRRAIDRTARDALRVILEEFVDRGGPVGVEALATRLPRHARRAVDQAIDRLDEKDLVLAKDSRVVVAYPFSAPPTAFTLLLPGGRERYAVCAVDALGVAALLGEPVTIRSRCHHSGDALEIRAEPDRVPGESEIMVWVGDRKDVREKACASL